MAIASADASTPVETAEPARNPSKWVLIYAAFGVFVVVVATVGWTRWITSDYFTPAETGPDHFGGWREVYLRVAEFGLAGISLYVAWIFLFRPLIFERRLDFDGMLIIGACFTWFWDPLMNINNMTFTYNAHFIDMGSWTQFIPFWHSPNQENIPEPLLFAGSAYLAWFWFLPLLAGDKFLRWILGRYKTMSILTAFALLFLAQMIGEVSLFIFTTYPELMQFNGAVEAWTIGAGHPWQFPLYDIMMAPFMYCTLASLRYFKDDQGRSWVERGVDSIKAGPKVRKLVSTLAVTGIINALLIFAYLIPYQFFAERVDTTPHMKSYMIGDVCGKRTDYACPGKYVPVPGKDTLHIRPDDPRLPKSVREAQPD